EGAGRQLADALRLCELPEVEGAEIGRRQVGDVELELCLCLRAPGIVSDPPPARVPRTEIVLHLDDHRIVGRVRAAGQSGAEIDKSKPEAFADTELEATRVHDHQKERGSWVEPALNPFDKVDPEQETPDLALGRGRRCAGLLHFDLALRESLVPVELDAIEGIADRLAVELEQRIELRPGATAPVLRVGQAIQVPELFAAT